MNTRIYRMWDFTPSHAQLLIRSVADELHPMNDDHLFAGVTGISMPTAVQGLRVVGPEELLRPLRPAPSEPLRYQLEGLDAEGERTVVGAIMATAHEHRQNELDLADSGLRTPVPLSPFDFERQVIAALARVDWADLTLPPARDGIDAVLTTRDARSILVEVKYVHRRQAPRSVRTTVLSLVRAFDQQPDAAGIAVVLGGADEAYESELRRHLITAFSGRPPVTLISWRPASGWESLVAAFNDEFRLGGIAG